MTSVEIPSSIACALPTLAVIDITNEVAHRVADSGLESGIVYVSALEDTCLVRVNERESGLFSDLEELLARLVTPERADRGRLITMLLGPRSEQVPFHDGRLCLGRWQRMLLFDFEGGAQSDWIITVLG